MSFTILNANANHIPLADKSVQCVVTSPPYWGLRDYGTATWVGGDEGCDHKIPAYLLGGGTNKDHAGSFTANYTSQCKCGATRIDSQIGLEKTPEEYVAKIVAVFREVWRVLRDDGTCWVNLGDSYSNDTKWGGSSSGKNYTSALGNCQGQKMKRDNPGLKPKDLVGIPWRVAFALQADGWYLRSAITWCKLNPMPESVTDRPTKATEQIFLLTKSERYYYDADAVREPNTDDMIRRAAAGHTRGANGKLDASRCDADTLRGEQAKEILANGRNMRDYWLLATQPFSGWTKTVQWNRVSMDAVCDGSVRIVSRDCSKHGGHSVLAASSLCDEHGAEVLIHNFGIYARRVRVLLDDFSPIVQLLEHWIEADNSGYLSPECALSASDHNNESHKKVRALLTNPSCIVCGKKLRRTADKITGILKDGSVVRRLLSNTSPDDWAYHPLVQIVSDNEHIPSCCCAYYNKETAETSHFATFPEEIAIRCIKAGSKVGDTILDPFSGAGTVPLVADKLNRRGIGLELKADYCRMAHDRCYDDAPLLAAMEG